MSNENEKIMDNESQIVEGNSNTVNHEPRQSDGQGSTTSKLKWLKWVGLVIIIGILIDVGIELYAHGFYQGGLNQSKTDELIKSGVVTEPPPPTSNPTPNPTATIPTIPTKEVASNILHISIANFFQDSIKFQISVDGKGVFDKTIKGSRSCDSNNICSEISPPYGEAIDAKVANSFTIKATDSHGNTTSKTFNYSNGVYIEITYNLSTLSINQSKEQKFYM